MGLKKDYEDLHYSDILGIDLKQNLLSSDLIIRSRFQGEIIIHSIGKKDAPQLERIISQYYAFGFGGNQRYNDNKNYNDRNDSQPEKSEKEKEKKKGFWR